MKQFFSDPKKRTVFILIVGIVLLVVLLAALILPKLFSSPVSDPGDSGGTVEGSSIVGTFEDVKTVDISSFPDLSMLHAEGAATFTFSDSGVSVDGAADGYEINGTALKIKDPGTYILTGTCADGSVTVAKETADVFLVLNGLHLTSATGPALTCNKASSVCVYLQAGSENTLSDPATEHEEGAALKFKSGSALILAGEGSLTVNGNGKNGIKGGSGSILNIVSGNITVTAKNNALACDNYLQIDGGLLTLTAENDGIKSSPDEGDTVSAGNVSLNGGTVCVSAVGDGVSADGLLSVSGGILEVTTTGEISNSSNDSFGFGGMGGPFGGWPGNNSTDSSVDEASSKGVKSGTAMKITGGQISVNSTDHALYCAGETVIEGGTLTLSSSASKGIKTAGNLTVSGDATQITVQKATEGIESKMSFTLNSGTVIIENASDDGINMGGSVSSSDAEAHALTVNGGTLKINARGDGLDSNGTFHMNGGTVVVFGPSNGGNSCLDIQYLSSFNGGTLLSAAASSSMWNEVVGHTSGNYIYTLSGGSVSGNATVEVLDGDGNVLISEPCDLTGQIGVYFMTDRVEDVSVCTFRIDGNVVTPQAGNGTGSSGGMGGFNPGGMGGGGGFGGPGGRR